MFRCAAHTQHTHTHNTRATKEERTSPQVFHQKGMGKKKGERESERGKRLLVFFFYYSTNQQNKGLISEDRRNKSTLPLTIPRSLYKSSAKDPVLAAKSEIVIRALGVIGGASRQTHHTPLPRFYGARPHTVKYVIYRCSPRVGKGAYHRYASTDSGLEAFSHNPTDGSFSPLAFRPRENTNYLNRLFLSY